MRKPEAHCEHGNTDNQDNCILGLQPEKLEVSFDIMAIPNES